MLGEVLVPGEAKKVAEFALNVEKSHAHKEYVVNTRKARVHKYFKKAPAVKVTAEQKKGPRWLPENRQKLFLRLTQLLPSAIPLVT